MNSLNIDTGSITLCINNDESRTITFNPSDVNFANRFYELLSDFEKKEPEFMAKASKVDDEMTFDENGVPNNLVDIFAVTAELDEYFKGRIDYVFGDGASKACFGDVNVMSVDKKGNRILSNFITAITPYITGARKGNVEKYTAKYSGKGKGKSNNAK